MTFVPLTAAPRRRRRIDWWKVTGLVLVPLISLAIWFGLIEFAVWIVRHA